MNKPTVKDIGNAVDELGAIPFFPTGVGAKTAVMRSLSSFVRERHHLRWLIDAALNGMREWKGIAELRALYCTRWKPLDGVEGGSCSIQGYTPADCEMAHIEAPKQKFLPAPQDSKITDGDRLSIVKLAEKKRI